MNNYGFQIKIWNPLLNLWEKVEVGKRWIKPKSTQIFIGGQIRSFSMTKYGFTTYIGNPLIDLLNKKYKYLKLISDGSY